MSIKMKGFVAVATYMSRPAVEHLALQQAGIAAFIDYAPLGLDDGYFELLVSEADADRARALLRSVEIKREQRTGGEGEVEFICDSCGKPVFFPTKDRGIVQDCPHCGEYLDVPE